MISRVLRVVFMVGVLFVLGRQFSDIGWAEIWMSLPTEPLFYLLFILIYCALPVTETIIYGRLLKFPFLFGLPFFFKKRVYNKDVLNYSGEVYLFAWADRVIDRPRKEVMHTIKDNNLLSALASTLFAVALLGAFFFSGKVEIPASYTENLELKVAVGALLVGLLIVVAVRFRRSIFGLTPGRLMGVFGTHLGRLTVVSTLQILQWLVVLPGVGMAVLFTFLSLQIIASRIPLLPARDLIFIGAAVEMAGSLDVSSPDVVGMLVVASAMDKLANLIIFLFVSAYERRLKAGQISGS